MLQEQQALAAEWQGAAEELQGQGRDMKTKVADLEGRLAEAESATGREALERAREQAVEARSKCGAVEMALAATQRAHQEAVERLVVQQTQQQRVLERLAQERAADIEAARAAGVAEERARGRSALDAAEARAVAGACGGGGSRLGHLYPLL